MLGVLATSALKPNTSLLTGQKEFLALPINKLNNLIQGVALATRLVISLATVGSCNGGKMDS